MGEQLAGQPERNKVDYDAKRKELEELNKQEAQATTSKEKRAILDKKIAIEEALEGVENEASEENVERDHEAANEENVERDYDKANEENERLNAEKEAKKKEVDAAHRLAEEERAKLIETEAKKTAQELEAVRAKIQGGGEKTDSTQQEGVAQKPEISGDVSAILERNKRDEREKIVTTYEKTNVKLDQLSNEVAEFEKSLSSRSLEEVATATQKFREKFNTVAAPVYDVVDITWGGNEEFSRPMKVAFSQRQGEFWAKTYGIEEKKRGEVADGILRDLFRDNRLEPATLGLSKKQAEMGKNLLSMLSGSEQRAAAERFFSSTVGENVDVARKAYNVYMMLRGSEFANRFKELEDARLRSAGFGGFKL